MSTPMVNIRKNSMNFKLILFILLYILSIKDMLERGSIFSERIVPTIVDFITFLAGGFIVYYNKFWKQVVKSKRGNLVLALCLLLCCIVYVAIYVKTLLFNNIFQSVMG